MVFWLVERMFAVTPSYTSRPVACKNAPEHALLHRRSPFAGFDLSAILEHVMLITLQTLEQRLTAMEREIADLKAELARSHSSASRGARLIQEARVQHAAARAAWQEVRERLGIQGEAIGAKQFRQRLVATGMNPDDNTVSRELIAMREE